MDKNQRMFLLVDQWKKSGLTRKAFAQQHGITDSKLEYWCRKRDNKVQRRTVVAPDFVELISKQESKSKAPEKPTIARVELELPDGIRILIY